MENVVYVVFGSGRSDVALGGREAVTVTCLTRESFRSLILPFPEAVPLSEDTSYPVYHFIFTCVPDWFVDWFAAGSVPRQSAAQNYSDIL